MAHGLELGTVLVPFAFVGAGCLALAGFIVYVRLRGPRLVDCHEVTLVSESPVTAIDRIEYAVRGQEHYSYRRIGLEQLEIVRSDAEPEEHAEKPLPELAGAILDLLQANARRVDGRTEVVLHGRAERRVLRAIRSALGRAPR
jgi:hypothetical protein